MPLKKRKIATHGNAPLVHSIPANSGGRGVSLALVRRSASRQLAANRPVAGRVHAPDPAAAAGDWDRVPPLTCLPPPLWGRVGVGGLPGGFGVGEFPRRFGVGGSRAALSASPAEDVPDPEPAAAARPGRTDRQRFHRHLHHRGDDGGHGVAGLASTFSHFQRPLFPVAARGAPRPARFGPTPAGGVAGWAAPGGARRFASPFLRIQPTTLPWSA